MVGRADRVFRPDIYDRHRLPIQPLVLSAANPGTTVHYDFRMTGVPNSTSGIDLVKH
jgi:hypothetical protein